MLRTTLLLLTSLVGSLGCSSEPGAAGAAGTSGAGGSGGSAGAAGCDQAESLLDVAKAPGAGAGYAAPSVTGYCTETTFVVESNAVPHYTFVQTTPNPLQAQNEHWEVPRVPVAAATTTDVPLLGTAGFAVNGVPFFGPNEAAVPPDEAYGDPVYNGLLDACEGHTAFAYHYHAMPVKCLDAASLVAEPWTNPDPAAGEASPIVGWALDGFAVYGPVECADAGCGAVQVMQSGYAKTGDPKTNAWDAYAWAEHAGDATYLDACNGHEGPNGDYHYHATEGFPYIVGCFRGTPTLQPGGPPGP